MSDDKLIPVEERLADGTFYRRWTPASAPRAAILLAHGLGEHSGRYQEFAETMAAAGFAVVAPDHKGHGLTEGPRAHIDRLEDFFAPLLELRSLIDEWYPGVPCFLVGHSMGGLISARFLLDHQDKFAAAALSGAALKPSEEPGLLLLWTTKLLSALFPTAGVLQLDATQVSRDADVVERYVNDPLVHSGKASARLVGELFAGMAVVKERANTVTLPVLVMHGEADAMTAAEGSREFFEAIASSNKQLKIYPGLYHEIFNEPERDAVKADLVSFFEACL